MAGDFEARVEGLDDLRRTLQAIPAKLRYRALRNALAAGARLVRDAARRGAPVLRQSTPYRTSGLLRKQIVVRTSKVAKADGDVGVFVNVRPAKKGLKNGVRIRGAKSPLDPYYWRWLEFGRNARAGSAARKRGFGLRSKRAQRAVGAIAPFRFLRNAASQLNAALQKFVQVIGPQIQKLDTNPKDPL